MSRKTEDRAARIDRETRYKLFSAWITKPQSSNHRSGTFSGVDCRCEVEVPIPSMKAESYVSEWQSNRCGEGRAYFALCTNHTCDA